jgi:hypothetical protein
MPATMPSDQHLNAATVPDVLIRAHQRGAGGVMKSLRHAVGRALIAPTFAQRAPKRALVIKCGVRPPTMPTAELEYPPDEESAAWYAELRAKQAAVR